MPYETFYIGTVEYFKCPKCPTDLSSEDRMDRHMVENHGGAPTVGTGLVDSQGTEIMRADTDQAERGAFDNVIGVSTPEEG